MMNKKLLKTDIDLQIEQFLTRNLLFFNQDGFNLRESCEICDDKHFFHCEIHSKHLSYKVKIRDL